MTFSNMLVHLRERNHITREGLAEQLKVSRQAVQNWESGAEMPDTDNVIRLAKLFGVTTDALLLGSDGRAFENKTIQPPCPNYAVMHSWESYAAELMVEYRQSLEEGRDISEYKRLFEEVSKMKPDANKSKMADILYNIVQGAKTIGGYAFDEPNELEAIRALRPPRPLTSKTAPRRDSLKDKIRGAWLGRVCGCLLGKPIEGIRTQELYPLLKESGNLPMRRYILSTDVTDDMVERFAFNLKGRCFADTISFAPADDDTNYTVLAQELIERCGRAFTPRDVAALWLDCQSKNAYCTAERVAYCNFVKGYQPPESAIWQNPYREWIGAQIRGDYFGYINPGDPETAAEMAWRDASISHVKNGIYGEMFVSAMIAEAAVQDDIPRIIEAGLGEIPAASRLYREISGILNAFRSGVAQADAFARIYSVWNEHDAHDWCHTISNAAIVTAALLYGRGEYGASVCLAVQTGFDTDCNGATVGSILGMRGGAGAIGAEWTSPIAGQLDTSIFGVGRVSLDAVIEKTLAHIG